MDKKAYHDFSYIVSYISPRLQKYLNKINEEIISKIQEIRIRCDRPIVIITDIGSSFLTVNGNLSSLLSFNCVIPTENDISDTISKMCDYSIHSFNEDMAKGFITLPNGARVGLSGEAVYDKNIIKGIKDIDGLNIRFPHFVSNLSDKLIKYVFKENLSNLLLVGPPSSGKTTVIKDLIYQLSSGVNGKSYKVCVIDERKEIVSSQKDASKIGPNTDVLSGFTKSSGISMAVRSLSPEIIVCDEIGDNEIDAIINTMNCGVSFIYSLHAKNYNELRAKNIFNILLSNSCIDYIAFLKTSHTPGVIDYILKHDVKSDEIIFNYIYSNNKFNTCSELYTAV